MPNITCSHKPSTKTKIVLFDKKTQYLKVKALSHKVKEQSD